MKFSRGQVSPYTMQEILVYLATQGAFESYDVPDWATGGTMVEEVMGALRELGSATSGDEGIPAGFDAWFSQYVAGAEVCEPSEIESEANGDGEDD